MESLEQIALEIEAIERHLSRRHFLRLAAFVAVVPRLEIDTDLRKFVGQMAGRLFPEHAVSRTGIDIVANIDRLLAQGTASHREKVVRLLVWARRISFLYGGPDIVVRARGSRFVLMQKMSKALAAICLVAFWGDERALALIDLPRGTA